MLLDYTDIATTWLVMSINKDIYDYASDLLLEKLSNYKFSHYRDVVIKKDTGRALSQDIRSKDILDISANGNVLTTDYKLFFLRSVVKAKLISNGNQFLYLNEWVYQIYGISTSYKIVDIKEPIKKLVVGSNDIRGILTESGKVWIKKSGMGEGQFVYSNLNVTDLAITSENIYCLDRKGKVWKNGSEKLLFSRPINQISSGESHHDIACLDIQGRVWLYNDMNSQIIRTSLRNVYSISDIFISSKDQQLSAITKDGRVRNISFKTPNVANTVLQLDYFPFPKVAS